MRGNAVLKQLLPEDDHDYEQDLLLDDPLLELWEDDGVTAEVVFKKPDHGPSRDSQWSEFKQAVKKGPLTRKFFMKALKKSHREYSSVTEEKMRQMIAHGYTPCLLARHYLIRSYCADAVVEYHNKNIDKSLALQNKAEAYFQDVYDQGYAPLPRTFQQLLNMYGDLEKHELVELFFDNAIKRGFKPNRRCCNIVISALRQLSKIQKALSVYQFMVKNKLKPNYTTNLLMFPVFFELDDLTRAETVYKKLGKFNIYKEKMFGMFVKHKELNKAKRLLQERIRLRDKYGEGGVQLRNLLSIACGRKKRPERALLPRKTDSLLVHPFTPFQ